MILIRRFCRIRGLWRIRRELLYGRPLGRCNRISDKEVSYWLKSDGFLAMWELYIYFDDNGNFESAEVAYAD